MILETGNTKDLKKISITFVCLALLAILFTDCSPINRCLRKAAHQTEKGNLVDAKNWYLKALQKDPDNYKANLGLGITLAEFMDRYDEGLPYLEKALEKSPKDTFVDLFFALGKCYEHKGQYGKALTFYNRLNNVVALADDNTQFQMELKKRKEDCSYGIAHPQYTPPKDWYVANLGKGINTDMPEYVPVITPENQLLFTSKRKDTRKETINYWDGKFFESMYIAEANAGGYYKSVRRYTLPDMFAKSRFRKHHESVISMSPDGKKLFVYRDARIYEIDMNARLKTEPKKMSKSVNFDYYQNHAYLTADGQTLFFTSESEGGLGGNDIYMSKRISEGVWDKPTNLGAPVNTTYDEDAPFMAADGKTLYFASKGHEGYGSFDIYKTTFDGSSWSKPENLGRPINSAAHDIFMVQNNRGNIGYFSSSRSGGQGDMDLYKVNYVSDFDLPCSPELPNVVSLSSTTDANDKLASTVTVKLADGFTALNYQWQQNGKTTETNASQLPVRFKEAGNYEIRLKVVAACDTCIQPYVGCSNLTLRSEAEVTPTATTALVTDINSMEGDLSDEQLRALGFSTNSVLFNFNAYTLREDAMAILDTNAEVFKKYPQLLFDLNGYTDQRGTEKYNQRLSLNRVEAVRKYLIKKGVNKAQLRTKKGFGETNFVYDCTVVNCDDAMHQANRRVNFKVSKAK